MRSNVVVRILHSQSLHIASVYSAVLKSQVVILQTAQTWANAGVCGGLCACAVGGTYN